MFSVTAPPLSTRPCIRLPGFCPAAFTLVELLTVIAVVGVLAGILVPVVGKARGSARTTACLSNLRQFGVASFLYANEHGGRLNYQSSYPGTQGWWFTRFGSYLSTSASVRTAQTVWLCPAVTDRVAGGGGADAGKDYAMSGSVIFSQSGTASPVSRLLGDFESPARKAYIIDIDATKNTALVNVSEFYDTLHGGKIDFRHQGRANVLFLDGHVRSFGAPPLPGGKNSVLAQKWLQHDTQPPGF
ncbi:MAG: prepilin-type N-terminal cleavage/methylation domain-containing protein [Opitutaceae bacterium]|jgi:general secretion pathway protein G|nr:prepilin-type N-terminal cleavage/methylation domain-containing protein [Opitutaceae bacterium]